MPPVPTSDRGSLTLRLFPLPEIARVPLATGHWKLLGCGRILNWHSHTPHPTRGWEWESCCCKRADLAMSSLAAVKGRTGLGFVNCRWVSLVMSQCVFPLVAYQREGGRQRARARECAAGCSAWKTQRHVVLCQYALACDLWYPKQLDRMAILMSLCAVLCRADTWK